LPCHRLSLTRWKGCKLSYQKPTVDLAEIRRKNHAAEREQQDGGKQRPKDAMEPN